MPWYTHRVIEDARMERNRIFHTLMTPIDDLPCSLAVVTLGSHISLIIEYAFVKHPHCLFHYPFFWLMQHSVGKGNFLALETGGYQRDEINVVLIP